MPLGRRQLFIYWRVAMALAPSAAAAARALQAQLTQQHPSLRCALFVRAEGPVGHATMMETYALESGTPGPGIGLDLQQHIEDFGASALKPWLLGKRHVEVFDACEG